MPNPSNKLNIEGQRFGKWTILEFAGVKKQRTMWKCRCECGNEKIVLGKRLRSGQSKSCGCLPHGTVRHGDSSRGRWAPEYKIWAGIKSRCSNPRETGYENYGGRGITVCQRWAESYEAFLEDMGRRPSPKHTIERIDNNKEYCKENCAWRTMKEQNNNTRRSRWIEVDGEKKTMSQWSDKTGLTYATIQCRLKMGWSERDAVTKPMRKMRRKEAV